MDDVNDMTDPNGNVAESPGTVEGARQTGVDRRTMLKAAVAAGTVAAVWVAPHIETFGFAPAFAATMCTVTNASNLDLQTNSSMNSYPPGGCGQSMGTPNNIDTIVFSQPTTTCTSFTVRSIPLDCTNNLDPDIAGFAVVPYDHVGACDCAVTAVFAFVPSHRNNPDFTFTAMANPFAGCPTGSATSGPTGPGVTVHLPCTISSSTRLAVQITCSTTGACH